MANEVSLTVTLNRPQFAATGQPQLAYVLVEAMPSPAIALAPMPLNFCFVLDHSGSMDGAKLANLKQAAKLAVDRLQAADVVSVVEFDDNARVIAASQPANDPNKNKIKGLIDRINSAGGTEMSKGMRAGLDELRKQVSAARVNRMLLLTDGQTNGDEKACLSYASDAKRDGITIAAYGLGADWNEALLDQIGGNSGGASNFIQNPSDIAKEFAQALVAAQGEVVQNAQLLLRLVAGCAPREAWRVLPQIQKLNHRMLSDRDVTVPMGSLDAKMGGSVLIELMLPPRPAGAYRIAQADLSYDVPMMNLQQQHAVADVMLAFTNDPQAAQAQDPRVANIVEKVSAFKLQTRAMDDLKTGNVGAATQKLRAAATRLLDLGEEELARVAQQEADNLQKGGKMTDLGTKKLNFGTRRLTQKVDDNG